jgi:hypothetical protein
VSDQIDILLPTRDDIAEDARHSWLVRSMQADPDHPADISKGSLPYLVGEVAADVLLPFYSNHDKIERSFVVRGMTGERLERYAKERLSLNEDGSVKLPATGGSGYMEATKIATGGAYMASGTVVRHRPTGTIITVAVSDTYQDGDPIPIVATTTGPDTNIDYDEQLFFDSPPPGVSQTATILSQNDGTGTLVGLTGGRDEETDEELQDRVIEAQSNPPAAGNSAEIVQVAQATPAVPVQKAFVIPAWFGAGSACIAFTLRPDANATRLPNSTQRGLVAAHLTSFPTDFNLSIAAVLGQTVEVMLGVTWISGANGWTDITPWPEHIPNDPVVVDGAASITTGAFRVTTGTNTMTPEIGQTIAVFSLSEKKFKRKRISAVSTVVASRSWTLTFSSDNGASDTYVPEDGDIISPWSPSINRIPEQIVSYFHTLGPGEQFASFPDPGGRQRRWPLSPEEWPSVIANEGLVTATKASGAIADVEVLAPSTPYTTTVGTPGVSVYLLQLGDLAVFPQT